MVYRAIYKCRLCGKEYEECITGEEVASLSIAFISRCGNSKDLKHMGYIETLYEKSYHCCKDGSYGLADFQGFKRGEA